MAKFDQQGARHHTQFEGYTIDGLAMKSCSANASNGECCVCGNNTYQTHVNDSEATGKSGSLIMEKPTCVEEDVTHVGV